MGQGSSDVRLQPVPETDRSRQPQTETQEPASDFLQELSFETKKTLTSPLLEEDVVVEPTKESEPEDIKIESKPLTSDIPSGEMLISRGYDDIPRGEVQPSRCNDAPFALFFYAQVVTIITFAIVYGVPAMKETANTNPGKQNESEFNGYGLFYLALSAGAIAIVLNFIVIHVMMRLGGLLITISLWVSAGLCVAMAVLATIYGNIAGAVIGAVFALFNICYIFMVRNRIPFAAANLEAALSAVSSNGSIVLMSYVFSAFMFGWTLIWTACFVGIMNAVAPENCDDDTNCFAGDPSAAVQTYIFFLLVSFFWTMSVIHNTQHCTIAGVVGTWWFEPSEARSFCSTAIWDSFSRAVTYSFGSICFGSLLQAIISALKQIVQNERANSNDNALLLCIIQCILSCLEDIIEYFNKWAFVYVGLYGYSYLEAGRKVMELFDKRGWTVIINDNLVSNALQLTAITIGLLTGVLGIIIDSVYDNWLSDVQNSGYVAFFLSFFVGTFIASVTMNVIDSAVDTVVVCFAEAPAEFEANHPKHSTEMKDAWHQVHHISF